MTVREKKVADVFGGVIGLLALWKASGYALQPFLDVRAELGQKQDELKELEGKIKIAQADLADYAKLCAMMPEPAEGGPRQNQTDLASGYFRKRIFDLIDNHPEIAGRLKDLRRAQIKVGSYAPKDLRGKELRQSTLPELSLEVSGTGDIHSVMRFLIEVYRADDLIYITDVTLNPVYRSSRKPETVNFSISMKMLVIERDTKLLAQVVPAARRGDEAETQVDAAGGDQPAGSPEAPQERSSTETDGQPPGEAQTSATAAAGAPDQEGSSPESKSEAAAEENRATPEEDLGRLTYKWSDYQRLLGWLPFEGVDPPPKEEEKIPDPVVSTPPRPDRGAGRRIEEEVPEEDRDWIVAGCFRGKTDVVILTRPDEGERSSNRGGRRRGGRGGRASAAEEEVKRAYKRVGDEFDGGTLEMVHRLGAVVRRKDKSAESGPALLWLYPYGKLMTESMLLADADRYREVQLAVERNRPQVEGPEPPPELRVPVAKEASAPGKKKNR
jgi:hypothetical protein